MGFNAGCVLWLGEVETKRVTKVVARVARRMRSGAGEALVAPRLAFGSRIATDDPQPCVGLVAYATSGAHPGNDLLVHALGRALRLAAVAIVSSDHFCCGAYELWLPPAPMPTFEDGRMVFRDARGDEIPREELRESGGLTVIGSVSIGGMRVGYLDVAKLGLAALLGHAAHERRIDVSLEDLFDSAVRAPGASITPISDESLRMGKARPVDADAPFDAHNRTWGFCVSPTGGPTADRRYELLSRPL